MSRLSATIYYDMYGYWICFRHQYFSISMYIDFNAIKLQINYTIG